MDRIKNEYIKRTAQVRGFGDKMRQARLRWLKRAKERCWVYREKDAEDQSRQAIGKEEGQRRGL